jgi:hypothetical protein
MNIIQQDEYSFREDNDDAQVLAELPEVPSLMQRGKDFSFNPMNEMFLRNNLAGVGGGNPSSNVMINRTNTQNAQPIPN